MSIPWHSRSQFLVGLFAASVGLLALKIIFPPRRIPSSQEPKTAETAVEVFPPATTFRLQGIPKSIFGQPISHQDVSLLVREAWNFDHNVHLTIYSLAIDPSDNEKRVATLTFQQVPPLFRPSQQVWTSSFRATNGISVFLQLDSNFLGFTPLHSGSDSKCTVDIIALSGLNGHAFGSFKERGGDKCFMWLRDALPEHFPEARIYVYGYDSKLTDTQNFQEIPDLALNFRNDLSNLVLSNPRELVLVGHSLGGIIVKETIIQMKAAEEAKDAWSSYATALLNRISALLFFGTPSEGLDNEALELMAKGQPNDRLVKSLGRSSGVLRAQMNAFRRVFEDLDFLAFWYYELENTPTPELSATGRWELTGEYRKLVEPTSATNGTPHDFGRHLVRGISRDHSEMVKFKGVHDTVYKVVRGDLTKIFSSRQDGHRMRLSDDEKEILKSLAYEAQDSRVDNVEDAHSHTCEWFFNSKEFCTWTDHSGSNFLDNLLWIKGKPGTGKSTLMLEAVRYTHRLLTDDATTIISFFFNARGVNLEKTPSGLYRSLLHQLLRQDPCTWKVLSSIFEDKRQGKDYRDVSWSDRDLKQCLEQVFTAPDCRPAIIFIDALDECAEDDTISVVEFFMGLTRRTCETDQGLRVCFSSRHYPRLSTHGCPELVMEQENAGDIRTYIASELNGQLGDGNDLFELQDILFSKSRAVFLWVRLAIARLKRVVAVQPGQTRRALENELEKLPSELQDLFSAICQTLRPEDQEQATFLIQLVLFAVEPLELGKIVAFLQFRPSSTFTTLDGWKHSDDYISGAENQAIMITRLSCGLLEFSNKSKCQFIHETVREYFLDPRNFSILSHSSIPTNMPAWSHSTIVSAAINYIRAFAKEGVNVDEYVKQYGRAVATQKLLIKYPLLSYLTYNLYCHIENAELGQISQESALRFLGNLDVQVKAALAYPRWMFELKPSSTQLYGCCKIGVRRLRTISRLIEMEENPKQIIDQWCDAPPHYPLIVATEASKEETRLLDLLLRNGAEVDLHDAYGTSALLTAARKNNLEAMQLLLSYGADVELRCNERPILLYTVNNGSKKATELLLRYGAKADSSDNLGETPLMAAGHSIFFEIFPSLIQAGADVNLRNRFGQVPLHSAFQGLRERPHRLCHAAYEAVESSLAAGLDLMMACKGRITLLEVLLDCLMEMETAGLSSDDRLIVKEIVCLLENWEI